jgi:hypothetical protein
MKMKRIIAFGSIALGTWLALTPASLADDKKDEAKKEEKAEKQQKAGDRAGGARDRLKQLAAELNLSEEQKEKLKAVFKEEGEKLRAIRRDSNLGPQEKRAKVRELREQIAGKVKPVLTQEQFERWQKMRQQGQRRRRQ